MAPSGTVYRLRNAFFQVTDVRTGEAVEFLSSDSGPPDARELTTMLLTGNYTVTLLDGWFLERIGSSTPGTAGATSSGGGFGSGGKVGGGFAGAFDGGPAMRKGPGKGGSPGSGVGGESSAGGEPGGEPSAGGAPSFGGTASFGGESGLAGDSGFGGGPSGGTGTGGTGGGSQVVEAQLLSDVIQFFSIFGGDDAFVHYQFRVGGEIVDFNRGRLHIGIGVEEDPSVCEPPKDLIKPQRVLLETNLDALNNVSLFGVLEALATNGGRNDDPQLIYQQIIDSYGSADQARLPGAVHCGDEQTDGVSTLNGYPIECIRAEHGQFDNLFSFFPTAFVNRMDLAPTNGAHCGQQRMIFASNAQNRMFFIIEAQVPNPKPELGIEGCLPLAQFWFDQNAIDDPFVRGQRLAAAFTTGLPELEAAGFGPFYTATNLTVGSGQIRTNQFDSSPWTLREFKLALDNEVLTALPFPVAESPHGALWNENSGFPQGPACRENFLQALDGLLTNDLAQMSFIVDAACKDAESRNDFSQDYASHLSSGFRQQIEERIQGTGLSADDIANRAQFAGSCMGCHQEASGRFLGNGAFAPFANDFVQVQEFLSSCSGGESGLCFPPSQAMTGVFLPSRLQVLGNLLGVPIIPNPCEGGGGGGFGGSTGTGGFPTMGGSFGSAGSFATAGSGSIPEEPKPEPAPAPPVDIELPSASEPIGSLQEEDAEIREAYGDVTISGRSAKSTH